MPRHTRENFGREASRLVKRIQAPNPEAFMTQSERMGIERESGWKDAVRKPERRSSRPPTTSLPARGHPARPLSSKSSVRLHAAAGPALLLLPLSAGGGRPPGDLCVIGAASDREVARSLGRALGEGARGL